MMQFLLLVIAWLMGAAVLFPGFSRAEAPAFFRLGVSAVSFGGLNRNDAAAALKAWSVAIVKEQNMNLQAELTVFEKFDSLRAAYNNNQLDALTLNVEEIMQLDVWPETVILPVIENELYVRYAIVVQENGGIKSPRDLLGQKMATHDTPRMLLATPWLETQVAEDAGKKVNLESGPQKIAFSRVENPSKAIFQVYFRQSAAALVTAGAFELACELNPQLRNSLKLLSVSPPFIHSVYLFRPDYEGKIKDKLENFMIKMPGSASRRQLLISFQCSRLERHPVSVLDSTRDFLMKYQKLRHKAGS